MGAFHEGVGDCACVYGISRVKVLRRLRRARALMYSNSRNSGAR